MAGRDFEGIGARSQKWRAFERHVVDLACCVPDRNVRIVHEEFAICNSQVIAGFGLSHGVAPVVLRASARSGAGVPQLWQAIAIFSSQAATTVL